jgi:hypothetical protein
LVTAILLVLSSNIITGLWCLRPISSRSRIIHTHSLAASCRNLYSASVDEEDVGLWRTDFHDTASVFMVKGGEIRISFPPHQSRTLPTTQTPSPKCCFLCSFFTVLS